MAYTSERAAGETLAAWKSAGVEVVVLPEDKHGLSLPALLDDLGRRGILQLLVEGGGVLQGSFLALGLVDEMHVFKGATVLGGTAQPWLPQAVAATIGDASFWQLESVQRLDNDVCLVYRK